MSASAPGEAVYPGRRGELCGAECGGGSGAFKVRRFRSREFEAGLQFSNWMRHWPMAGRLSKIFSLFYSGFFYYLEVGFRVQQVTEVINSRVIPRICQESQYSVEGGSSD